MPIHHLVAYPGASPLLCQVLSQEQQQVPPLRHTRKGPVHHERGRVTIGEMPVTLSSSCHQSLRARTARFAEQAC
jgi:hypothetical protein